MSRSRRIELICSEDKESVVVKILNTPKVLCAISIFVSTRTKAEMHVFARLKSQVTLRRAKGIFHPINGVAFAGPAWGTWIASHLCDPVERVYIIGKTSKRMRPWQYYVGEQWANASNLIKDTSHLEDQALRGLVLAVYNGVDYNLGWTDYYDKRKYMRTRYPTLPLDETESIGDGSVVLFPKGTVVKKDENEEDLEIVKGE